jgi:hypothetical protein
MKNTQLVDQFGQAVELADALIDLCPDRPEAERLRDVLADLGKTVAAELEALATLKDLAVDWKAAKVKQARASEWAAKNPPPPDNRPMDYFDRLSHKAEGWRDELLDLIGDPEALRRRADALDRHHAKFNKAEEAWFARKEQALAG